MAEGAVEHWLMKIQEMMVKSLYDCSKQSLKEFPIRIHWTEKNGCSPTQPVYLAYRSGKVD
jgi:hypothetical protein